MGDRKILEVAIRIIGLWRILINALSNLNYLIYFQIQTAHPTPVEYSPLNINEERSALVGVIFNVVVGIAIIIAAPALVRSIYRDPATQP